MQFIAAPSDTTQIWKRGSLKDLYVWVCIFHGHLTANFFFLSISVFCFILMWFCSSLDSFNWFHVTFKMLVHVFFENKFSALLIRRSLMWFWVEWICSYKDRLIHGFKSSEFPKESVVHYYKRNVRVLNRTLSLEKCISLLLSTNAFAVLKKIENHTYLFQKNLKRNLDTVNYVNYKRVKF